ncbi:PREDICTED: cytochrome c-type biogenesis protein CycH-like, partial [Priapulus caudatus]|uniref:Cytochrome c-type biogenesis protein CycH-like n=1 Tax=Priapulus caudatus TaxID=37621 RepID=A0ABM1F7E3_PRICU
MILPPLLKKTELEVDDRRDQNIQIAKEQLAELETSFSNKEMKVEAYQQRRDELEQSLYTDVEGSAMRKKSEYAKPTFISAALIALLVPIVGVSMYATFGNSKAADPEVARVASKVPMTADGRPDVDAMVTGLRKKLDDEPNNPKGWYMLGRSYMALKRYDDAAEAYKKLLGLQPEDAKVMLFLADAEAMKNGGDISGQPSELIEKSLAIEPNSVTGL